MLQVTSHACGQADILVVAAAGNNNGNACLKSPASAPNAITVGSTTSSDSRSSFSNYGPCVDIFAPGSGIKAAGTRSDTSTTTKSGTSMACPHVAGAAALLRTVRADFTTAQTTTSLLCMATRNALIDPNVLHVLGDVIILVTCRRW
jgi:subtilisin family serine protease